MIQDNIHNPITVVRTSSGELVEVRELTWKNCLTAIKKLTDTVLELLGKQQGGSSIALTLDKEKLVSAITSQEELVTWALMKSTGRDQAWVDALSARDCLALVKAMVDQNLSDEVLAAGKGLADRMGAVFGRSSKSPAQ